MVKVNLKIYFIRHGFSCANAVRKYVDSKERKKYKLWVTDPPLTKWGVQSTFKVKKKNLMPDDVDILCSSVLLRAIQTALYSFDAPRPVFVLPYVSEIGHLRPGSMFSSIEHQQGIFGSKKTDVDYRFVVKGANKSRPAYEGEVEKKYKEPDYDNFIRWLKYNLQNLVRASGVANSLKHVPDLTIAIVSHSVYMERFLSVPGAPFHYNNNATVVQNFEYTEEKGHKYLDFVPSGVVFGGVVPPPDINKFVQYGGFTDCGIVPTEPEPRPREESSEEEEYEAYAEVDLGEIIPPLSPVYASKK